MLMNSLTAYALGPLLNARLKNSVIRGIYQYPGLVTISLSSSWSSYIHIFFSGPERDLVPSNSLIAGREHSADLFKQTAGCTVTGVKTPGTNRIILINLTAPGSWGRDRDFVLRLDFIPSNSPATLFGGEKKRVISTVNPTKSITPRSPDDVPATQNFSLLTMPDRKPGGFLEDAGVSENSLHGRLFNLINGLDPLLARAIIRESGGDPDSVWDMTRRIRDRMKDGNYKWNVCGLEEKERAKTVLYPISLPVGQRIIESEDYSEAAGLHAERTVLPLFVETLRNRAAKEAGKELKRLRRLRKNLSKDLDKAARSEEFHLYGNLLTTHFGKLEKGMEKITLPDFSEKEEIIIPLDSTLGPQQNIQKYFKKAQKGKKGRKKIKRRLRAVEKSISARSDSLDKLLKIKNPGELLELIPQRDRPSSQQREKPGEDFRRFVLDKHHTVFVGRNAGENDLLTHKFSSKRDLWFHAKGIAGSHVILKGGNPSTPPDILKTTASIAAYYSKARNSKIVPVAYTEKRYVRKPKKSPPGTAAIERETVLFVHPSIPSSD
ncbi:MAG: NFACT RNA binding domain-containing protein [Candidatus Krumholzibacteriota bacterium]|nr:NFACT RNA binding domain-containing protein [Candidatus Krumholzibacteriota bacterium]